MPAPREPARPGRPTDCTPERTAKIVQAISAGNYGEVAARYAGIDPRTYYRWLERGRAERTRRAGPHDSRACVVNLDEQPFYQFCQAVEKAEADAEARNVAIIQTAARETWQAAAWYLERKHADRWGRRDRVDLRVLIEQEAARAAQAAGVAEGDVMQEINKILAEMKGTGR